MVNEPVGTLPSWSEHAVGGEDATQGHKCIRSHQRMVSPMTKMTQDSVITNGRAHARYGADSSLEGATVDRSPE